MCNAMLFLIKVGADWQSVLIIDWPYGYAKGKKSFFREIGKRHWTMTMSFDLMDLRGGNLGVIIAIFFYTYTTSFVQTFVPFYFVLSWNDFAKYKQIIGVRIIDIYTCEMQPRQKHKPRTIKNCILKRKKESKI